jgi:hypothetical protein
MCCFSKKDCKSNQSSDTNKAPPIIILTVPQKKYALELAYKVSLTIKAIIVNPNDTTKIISHRANNPIMRLKP